MKNLSIGLLLVFALGFGSCSTEKKSPLNVLLITVDDMNFNSIGVFDCPVPNTTPNIDRMAKSGVRFAHSYVAIAVCQPCRATIMTGMYPHNSGVTGFNHIPEDAPVPLLPEELKKAGYFTGVLGKVKHSSPKESQSYWDFAEDGLVNNNLLGYGRNKDLYYQQFADFIKKAQENGKPFFMNANAHDPHRPFALSDQESGRWKDKGIAMPSKVFKPEEVIVPAFLPDIPDVRLEISEYYSSVRRADDVVGSILKVLEESGEMDNTMIVFMSDHGMALPFAKTNCYLNSNKTPLIVIHPDIKEKDVLDQSHFVSTIDLLPTILESAGVPIPEVVDGKSFLPVLFGEKQAERDHVFTEFSATSSKKRFPMRAVHTADYFYIYNPWSDGERKFANESMNGRTFKAMHKAAETNEDIAEIVDFFLHRVTEEFYDSKKDPDALSNQIANSDYNDQLEEAKALLMSHLEVNNDPVLEAFRNLGDEEFRKKFMEKQNELARLEKEKSRKQKKMTGKK